MEMILPLPVLWALGIFIVVCTIVLVVLVSNHTPNGGTP
jgi:hypothetical protein